MDSGYQTIPGAGRGWNVSESTLRKHAGCVASGVDKDAHGRWIFSEAWLDDRYARRQVSIGDDSVLEGLADFLVDWKDQVGQVADVGRAAGIVEASVAQAEERVAALEHENTLFRFAERDLQEQLAQTRASLSVAMATGDQAMSAGSKETAKLVELNERLCNIILALQEQCLSSARREQAARDSMGRRALKRFESKVDAIDGGIINLVGLPDGVTSQLAYLVASMTEMSPTNAASQ